MLVPDDDDEFHSSQFGGDPSRTAFHRIVLKRAGGGCLGRPQPVGLSCTAAASSPSCGITRSLPRRRRVTHGLKLTLVALCCPVPALPDATAGPSDELDHRELFAPLVPGVGEENRGKGSRGTWDEAS